MHWYAATTKPNGELKAYERLTKERVACFLPRANVRTIRKRRDGPHVVWVTKAVYPRYLFLRLQANQLWLAPKCKVSLVRLTHDDETDTNHPTPIPDEIMTVLQAGFDPNGIKLQPEQAKRARFQAMQQVRYREGHPYRDLMVRVIEDDGEDFIRVLITIFGRDNAAKVAASELEAA